VVVGDFVGHGSAQEQAVVGDTPNLAARLQGLVESGGVVVSAATRRHWGKRIAVLKEIVAPQDCKRYLAALEIGSLAGDRGPFQTIMHQRPRATLDEYRHSLGEAAGGRSHAQAYLPPSYRFSHSPDSCSIQAMASAFLLNPSISG